MRKENDENVLTSKLQGQSLHAKKMCIDVFFLN